jgi:transcriptional regulator with XRE-family HTH domain
MEGVVALFQTVRMAKTGHFLRAWRQHRGLTLEQAAERVPTTHATLSRIERGKLPYNQALLEILADVYMTDPASLLMRDPSSPDALWSIWDRLAPVQKEQVTEMAKVLKRTGTG